MNADILARIRQRLRATGLDAYIAYTPSNVFYATGFQSYFLMEWWRMHGTVMVVIPADGDLPPGLMISDFEAGSARAVSGIDDVRPFRLWVELRDAVSLRRPAAAGEEDRPRPAQYDTDEQDRIMSGLLEDRGLLNGRIGTDLRHMLHDSYTRLTRTAPGVTWVDFTDDIYRIRSVKLPFEIERLRCATELSESGMTFAVSEVHAGMTAVEVRQRYMLGVLQAAMSSPRYAGYTDQWVLPAVGGGVAIGVDSERAVGLREGDLIKFDCGVTFGGYRSDGGRTFAYRRVTAEAGHLYDVLIRAHERARSVMKPGVPVSDVFRAAHEYIRGHGYPRFTRGHYGHSVGIDTFHEEPPFVAANEDTLLEVDMVFAIETPAYTTDVGAIMIEDLVRVVPGGIERLHRLPDELVVVG